jgi:hypothetical protein
MDEKYPVLFFGRLFSQGLLLLRVKSRQLDFLLITYQKYAGSNFQYRREKSTTVMNITVDSIIRINNKVYENSQKIKNFAGICQTM